MSLLLLLRNSAAVAKTTVQLVYEQALGREIGDRIIVKKTPPETPAAGGPRISQEVTVEGIRHEFADSLWQTTFQLAPADPNTTGGSGYWILGDPTYSVLGTTTRLAP